MQYYCATKLCHDREMNFYIYKVFKWLRNVKLAAMRQRYTNKWAKDEFLKLHKRKRRLRWQWTETCRVVNVRHAEKTENSTMPDEWGVDRNSGGGVAVWNLLLIGHWFGCEHKSTLIASIFDGTKLQKNISYGYLLFIFLRWLKRAGV